MANPFEIIESNQVDEPGLGFNQTIGLVDQFLSSEKHLFIETIGIKVIRAAISEIIRQRSDLGIQLEDLQEETLHEQRAFYLKLLNIGDSLDRLLRMLDPANEAIETINAVRTQFLQILENVNIYPIELNLGQAFDANTCEVSSQQERPDLQPKTIISVERRGYKWGDRVLRHARVGISVNSKGG
jgi:molecular chaperone GrpE (heat shock protein)